MSEPPAARSKLQEQATSKKDLSYSYWAANEVTDAAPPAVPKRLTEEEVAALERQREEHKESTGASAWNKAGTFEERNVTEWAKKRLQELLEGSSEGCQAASSSPGSGVTVAITGLSSCTGEAHQWLVRGKKRGGFEFELVLKWKAQLSDSCWAAGTARVPEFTADDLDELQLDSVAVTERSEGLETAAEEQARQAARTALLSAVEQQLRQLLDLLKQK